MTGVKFATAMRLRPNARMGAAAILVGGCVVSLALNWPGQLSYDSVVQLHDGRTGHYNSWHPPVMAWMLGLADSLVTGTGLFIVFNTVMLFVCLLSLLWVRSRVPPGVALAAAICVSLPQILLYQGIVWKDVLFADAAIAGFVILAHADRWWGREILRRALFCAAILLFALASLARQNGAIALAFGALAVASIAKRNGFHWRGAVACGLGAMAAALAIVLAASVALAARTIGVSGPQVQIKLLQLYDLIGEVRVDPALGLDELRRVNPALVQAIRTDGVRLYTPARNDTLTGSFRLQNEFADTDPAAISAQWWDALLNHPADYLRVRARVYGWVLFTPDLVQCAACYTGVNGPSQYLRDLGLKHEFRPQDRVLANYANLFVSTPAFSHAAYALLALALLVFLIRRSHPSDLAIVSLLAAALVFALSFFVISIACDYRYLLFLDLASLTGFFYCVATWAD